MPASLTRPIAGFIAGALAVLVFHQAMYWLLGQVGVPLRGAPWRMTSGGPYGVPVLVNQMFWGGLWGIVFAYMMERMPGGPVWSKGFFFGMIFPMLLGSWIIVALIKGRPLLSGAFANGFNPMALRTGFLLNGVAFGIGLGLIYPMLARALARREGDAAR